MLKKSTLDIIKSTVPVLAQHGTKVTKRFYELLFTNHPELKNVFNQVNQRQGRQPAALFNAVYAAAANIENLEKILPVVTQIAHKHRALGIKPEQYPIVGDNLLKALKDVLGPAATDDVIKAWGEAYGVIADAFIGVEAKMYEEAENIPGGWKDFREFVIDKKVKESDIITSFYLKPKDGKAIATFQPGQYITLRVKPEGHEYTSLRHYSLSDAPGKGYYRISVKREEHGLVSNYLHNTMKEGDTIEVGSPAGDFVLHPKDDPAILISGGVGITPMMSMLHAISTQQPHRQVHFIHGSRNRCVHALHEEVHGIVQKNANVRKYVKYSETTETDADVCDARGFIDKEYLKSIVEKSKETADYYFCGPVEFMRSVNKSLKELGVPQEKIHFEFFGPAAQIDA